MSGKAPRIVVVTRETDYQLLLARHATRGQAAFFLDTRGQSIDEVEARHTRFEDCLQRVRNVIPVSWRRNHVLRRDLSRFLFEPDDTIVVVGQDGLVPNVAKYISGQPVIGINPDASLYEGVLVPHAVDALEDLLEPTTRGEVETQSRTMVEARLGDGQRLMALNELFVGCRTHQSARYRIHHLDDEERHSSSGIIITTGTGATGWAKSIYRQRRTEVELPLPEEHRLAFFVREAWPSVATGTDITDGDIGDSEHIVISSEMNEGGVIFGDGIETDRLGFDWGVSARIGIAPERLELVCA